MRPKRPASSTKNQPTDESTAKKEKLVEPADTSDPVWSIVNQIVQEEETTDSNAKKVSLIFES